MHVLLKPVNRNGAPVLIRKGQEVRVGSTEWADHAFPGDPDLLGIHFCVSFCDDRPSVTAMDGAVIQVNGKERTSSNLRDGQQLQAGQSIFLVEVEGVEDEPSEKDDPSGRSTRVAGDEDDGPLELQPFDLSCDLEVLAIRPLGGTDETPTSLPEIINAFVSQQRHLDAIQFIAWVLPPAANLQWVTETVERYSPDPSPDEQRVLELARAWCDEPASDLAEEVHALARVIPADGAIWWVTRALAWCPENDSESGMTPPRNMPPTASRGAMTTLAYGLSEQDPVLILEDCLAAGLALTE